MKLRLARYIEKQVGKRKNKSKKHSNKSDRTIVELGWVHRKSKRWMDNLKPRNGERAEEVLRDSQNSGMAT